MSKNQQWEYKVDYVGEVGTGTESMNKLGLEGWELIAVLPRFETGHVKVMPRAFFKRPAQPKPSGKGPSAFHA